MASGPIDLLRFSGRRRLPVVHQTEAAECGLACLAMVVGYHGHRVDLNSLRRDYPISLKGTTLKGLMNTADRLRLATRAVRCELDELDELLTPAVLHWDLNHFVVLKSVGRRIVIHDPAVGERRLPRTEVSKHFTGVALELTPAQGFKRKDELRRMRLTDFWHQAIGLKGFLVQIFALALLLELFALASPFFMQLVVDEVIVSHDVDLLLILALGFGMLAAIRIGVTALRAYVVMYIGNMLSMQMGSNLFRHLIRLPITFFERRHIGDIVSRFGAMGQIKSLFTSGLVEAVVDGIMAVGTVAMMFIYAPVLGWIVVGAAVLFGLFRLVFYRPFRERTHESILASAEEQSNFMETVRGAQSIKLFGGEVERQALWHNRYADEINAGIRVSKLGIGFSAVSGVFFGAENIAVVYLGAKLVLDGGMTIGMLFAFMSYKGQFESKSQALISKLIQFKMLELYLHRIADIAHTPVEAGLEEGQQEGLVLDGGLVLDQVGFSYSETEADILTDANLSVTPGEAVAVVGPSGCGKSTLIKLMMGLLPATAGEVRANGVDIRKLGLRGYRRQVAAVMQDDQLLSGSIADNICFFETERDQARIQQCAQWAAVHDDIMAMPMTYHSLIGDMGTVLSGGQKQRLLLARALYRQPRILVLDEATSHVDVQLERRIVETLAQLKITRILVSHRPETIRFADRVFALSGGQLSDVTDQVFGDKSA